MVKKIYIPFIVFLAIIYNINIIRPTVIGCLVDLFTKQDQSQEINSQGNSGISNNIKISDSVIKIKNLTLNIPALPVLPVLHLGKKAYDAFESNACVTLEIIHLSNNVLYDFAKTNLRTYEFLTNTLEEDFFKSSCTK